MYPIHISTIILYKITTCFTCKIYNYSMMISRTIWTDNKLSPSDGDLTSYEQSGVQRRKCILTSKVAGCNLTFPETVIEVQGGSPDQQAAIAAATSHPLVFIRMHAHRFPVFLPDTLPAFVLYPAAQLYIVAGRYLLVKRRCFYKPLLADDARDVRNNEEEYREMDYTIESHHFLNGRNDSHSQFTIWIEHLRTSGLAGIHAATLSEENI